MKQYFVYIMSSARHIIYVGVTNDLFRRVWEHKNKAIEGYTKLYNCTMLVYYEEFNDIKLAIQRETQLKGWLRKKKVELIKTKNPSWQDLSKEWYLK